MAVLRIQGEAEKRAGIYYEVDTERPPVGVGGMGQVCRGVRIDSRTGVRIPAAIKFLFDDLPESAIQRSRREASIVIKNENLVEMFGFIEIDEPTAGGASHRRYHVASEFLSGVMLYDLLKGRTTDGDGNEMPFAKELYRMYVNDRTRFVVFIIKSVLSGIMALHDAGYIHRDIDPSNIMITSSGKVKIIDFGISKQLTGLSTTDQHLTTSGQFMGKAAYASPELVTGDILHQNESTDLYAVGIMMFELFTGHVPFEGATHEVLLKQLKEKLPLKEISDRQARKIIARATAKKQSERYTSAAEFRVDVEQLGRSTSSGGSNGGGVSDGGDKDIVPFYKRKSVVIAGVVAAVAVVAVAVAVPLISGKAEKEEAERKAYIESMTALMNDSIIDSSEIISFTDSLTGVTVKSAGAMTKEGMELLKQPSDIRAGIEKLRRVADKGYASSADALYALAGLYSHTPFFPEEPDSSLLSAIVDAVPLDYGKSLDFNEKSSRLAADSYRPLYSIGREYLLGDIHGVVERDLEKAHSCFTSGLERSEAAGDTTFAALFREQLDVISSALSQE